MNQQTDLGEKQSKPGRKIATVVIGTALAATPVTGMTGAAEGWQFGASIYGWFPDISGDTSFTPPGGGGDFEVGIDQILENLEFTLMGTFDARKGNWGLLVDMLYLDVGDSQSGVRDGTVGNTPIPADASADVSLDMESWVGTVAGYYRALDRPNWSFDLVGGLRYLDVSQKISWDITGNVNSIPAADRSGTGEASLENVDAIIGVRGQHAFGTTNQWFVPYYLDVGAGDSDLTLQVLAGIGYRFRWGEVVGAWRYLAYDLPSDKAIADVNFNGPAVGAVFRW